MGLESVRLCVRAPSNINIYLRPAGLYLKHHWGRAKAALGFGPDQIETLVSMATESSHRVIMG